MKTIKFFLIAFVAITSLQSCRKDSPWGIRGSGSDVTEVRNITSFDGIKLNIDADVYYEQSQNYYVEITAQQNVLPVTRTSINGGVLKIDFSSNVFKHDKIRIVVHSPDMHELNVSGSGDIIAGGAINTSSINLTISGSGHISLPLLNASVLNANISGSGNLNVYDGNVGHEDLRISGSGKMNLLNLQAGTAKTNTSGSGDMELFVINNLDVRISGSGCVKYRGTPVVTSSISGSGKVVHLN